MKCLEIKIETPEPTDARLHTYFLENYEQIDPYRKRPVILICPGGGYRYTCDREAEAVAIRYNAMGYHACILRYSIKPCEFPQSLCELAWCVSYLRTHAQKFCIDTEKIIPLGFSAGGHLAASLGVFWNQNWLSEQTNLSPDEIRPNAMILCYPVIIYRENGHLESFQNLLGTQYSHDKASTLSLERSVSRHTPPTFLWHTFEDQLILAEHSLTFANALWKAQVPLELHIYPKGLHGLSLANEETQNIQTGFGIQKHCQSWIHLSGEWIKELS